MCNECCLHDEVFARVLRMIVLETIILIKVFIWYFCLRYKHQHDNENG